MIRHLNRTFKCIKKSNVIKYSDTELNDLSMKRIIINDDGFFNDYTEDNDAEDDDAEDDDTEDDDTEDDEDEDDNSNNKISKKNDDTKNMCINCNKKFTRGTSLRRHIDLDRCSKKLVYYI